MNILMAFELSPRSWFTRWPDLIGEMEWPSLSSTSGLSVYEAGDNLIVEASVPGIDPKAIDVTVDKGVLWIKGSKEEKEEDKDRKYYRKSARSFSYRIDIPDNVDTSMDPEVNYDKGMLSVVFKRVEGKEKSRKLPIKTT